MNKAGFFLINLLMNGIRFKILLFLGLGFSLVGAFWLSAFSYIGAAILILYLLICLVSAVRMQIVMTALSADDPEFAHLLENISEDPKGFMADIINKQEQNKGLHGADLLVLSDDDLFETVYFQNLEIASNAEDSDREVEQFAGARLNVFVLSLFDSEIQNGGLCQFFVNSSRTAAPYVSDALEAVGASAHKELFDSFTSENKIDTSNLDSFKVFSKRGYIKQTKRFDFDSFDEKYYDLPPLQDKVVDYIRKNISEF